MSTGPNRRQANSDTRGRQRDRGAAALAGPCHIVIVNDNIEERRLWKSVNT